MTLAALDPGGRRYANWWWILLVMAFFLALTVYYTFFKKRHQIDAEIEVADAGARIGHHSE